MSSDSDLRVLKLKARRSSTDWQDRYQALEEARQLPAAGRAEVAEAFVKDENAWVRSLASQLVAVPGTPARRSRRGIVREVDQIVHGAHLSFDQRWRLIRLFEEAEESGSTAQLGLAVDRASRLVTAALSEPHRSAHYMRQLDAFLRHVAMYVRPVPVASESAVFNEVVKNVLSAFDLRTSVTGGNSLRVRGDALDRALREIAQNALDAGSSHLQIQGDIRDGHVVVGVTNDGARLAPAEIDGLFRAWYTTRVGHAGLGLYLARAALNEAGGSIILADPVPVAFEITMPR